MKTYADIVRLDDEALIKLKAELDEQWQIDRKEVQAQSDEIRTMVEHYTQCVKDAEEVARKRTFIEREIERRARALDVELFPVAVPTRKRASLLGWLSTRARKQP